VEPVEHVPGNVVEIALRERPARHHGIELFAVVVDPGRNRTLEKCESIGMFLIGNERFVSQVCADRTIREFDASRSICLVARGAISSKWRSRSSNLHAVDVSSGEEDVAAVDECGARAARSACCTVLRTRSMASIAQSDEDQYERQRRSHVAIIRAQTLVT
jgi:hypothetical protein